MYGRDAVPKRKMCILFRALRSEECRSYLDKKLGKRSTLLDNAFPEASANVIDCALKCFCAIRRFTREHVSLLYDG